MTEPVEPIWLKIMGVFAPALFTLTAFLFGKATKGAINEEAVTTLKTRVAALETWQLTVMSTLASHNTLHDGYAKTLIGIQSELRELNTNVSRLSGVLQGNGRA